MRGYRRYVFLPDIHFPFEDKRAVSAALAFTKAIRPHYLYLLGDLVDFYTLSRFSKDPSRILQLQYELDLASGFLLKVREIVPDNTEVVLLAGNHEDRLRKYLWDRAPEMSGLRGLRVSELLGLRKLRIRYVETGRERIGGLLLAKHGSAVRLRAGYTATAELERVGLSGVSGHTHRLAQVYKTREGGEYTWAEAGCLCRLDPEYMENETPDWQHGLAWAEVRPGKRFHLGITPIIDGRITWGGQDFGGRGK